MGRSIMDCLEINNGYKKLGIVGYSYRDPLLLLDIRHCFQVLVGGYPHHNLPLSIAKIGKLEI